MTSLLVVNSGSRIAQASIKSFYKQGKFDQIVCADLYPSYESHFRYLNFAVGLNKIESPSAFSDVQFQNRQDLLNLIKQTTHVLYVTHDYYANVPSKQSLLKSTTELVQQNPHIEQFVVVAPKEYDHMRESYNAQLENEYAAKDLVPGLSLIKSDITFGPDSTVLRNICTLLSAKKYFNYYPCAFHPSPVHSEDLVQAVDKVFDDKLLGDVIICQGEEVRWDAILAAMQKAAHRVKEPSLLHKFLSPLSNNIFSERYFYPHQFNQAQLVANYIPLVLSGRNSLKTLGIKQKSFEEYSHETFVRDDVAEKTKEIEGIKNTVYSL